MTDEQGRQLGNVERGAMHYRAADAGYTFVRIDLHERFNDPVVSINSRLARARGTEFRVDVSRTNESFFEERIINLHRAGQLTKPNVGDFHRCAGDITRSSRF